MNFYEIEQIKNKDFQFLEETQIYNKSYDLLKYLHGFCDEFAIYMSKKLNYNIGFITKYSEESDTEYLIHAFNYITIKDITYYIDIRGITTSFEVLVEPFCDEYSIDDEDSNIYLLDKKEGKKALIDILNIENYYIENIKELKIIFNSFNNIYNINI